MFTFLWERDVLVDKIYQNSWYGWEGHGRHEAYSLIGVRDVVYWGPSCLLTSPAWLLVSSHDLTWRQVKRGCLAHQQPQRVSVIFCSSATYTEVQSEGGYNTAELFSVAWCSIILVSYLGYTLDGWTTTRVKNWLVCWAHRLVINGSHSTCRPVLSWIPQGSVCVDISCLILLSVTWRRRHDVPPSTQWMTQNWEEPGDMLEGRAVIQRDLDRLGGMGQQEPHEIKRGQM